MSEYTLSNGQTLCPITIVQDRYTGVYSGGKWTAWNHDPQDIPSDIDAEDTDARNIWIRLECDETFRRRFRFGVGNTIDEAIKALIRDVEERGEAPESKISPIVFCRDCKYRPIKKDYGSFTNVESPIKAPFGYEDMCPCLRGDSFYCYVPEDYFYCANGRRKE